MENTPVKIYKLYDKDDNNLCYYGSTKQSLKKRLYGHEYRRECRSRIIIDRNNYEIELIEEVTLEKRKEREYYYIQNYECVNRNGKVNIENIEKRKEHAKKYMKNYHQVNKERNKKRLEDNIRKQILELSI